MHILLALRLFSLTVLATPAQQADALLSYTTFPVLDLLDQVIEMDSQGNLWLAGVIMSDGKIRYYITKISPNGIKNPEMVPLLLDDICSISEMAFDKYGNVFVPVLLQKGRYHDDYYFSLLRISTEGEVQDYTSLWPKNQISGESFVAVTPGETLVVAGKDKYSNAINRIAKALVTFDGITPLDEYSYNGPSGNALSLLSDGWQFSQPYTDWQAGFGINANVQGNELHLSKLYLTSESSYNSDYQGQYNWRSYIWRSYKDVWIGANWTKNNEGGYNLYIPDPDDETMTHVIRIGDDFVPIDPSTLGDGGIRNTLAFTRLPKDSKPYADYKEWGGLHPDSARVRFWGCDEKGNLYYYQKTKKR